MPHIETLIPKKHPMGLLFGQLPLTKFTDYRKAIKVDLIKWDDPVAMIKGTFDFAKATWSLDGKESDRATDEQMQDAMEQMLSGKALGLGLETVNFMFRISGITRQDTHQIVRQRIGVTFSQHCSGDQWWSHRDCLVEECINQDERLISNFIDSTVDAKMNYVDMIDSQKVSIQAARLILPHNLSTFIFMNVNLMTFLFFHQKRIDDGSQTWQINEIAQQMADQICEKFPALKETFEKNKKKFKFQKEASADRGNSFSTGLYLPKVDDYDYHNRDVVYPMTKEQMHFTNTPIKDSYYWGIMELTKEQYNIAQEKYAENNKKIHENCPSNEEILKMNQQSNSELSNLFLKQNDESTTN